MKNLPSVMLNLGGRARGPRFQFVWKLDIVAWSSLLCQIRSISDLYLRQYTLFLYIHRATDSQIRDPGSTRRLE